MEQALEERRVPYFDGFVGSNRAFLDIPSMEDEKLSTRWTRLWKLHGSINWWRSPLRKDGHNETENGVEKKREKIGDDDCQMIHPSHLKYEQSRRMPYLAMLDRFKFFLARPQSVLVTCGYSFADQHINEIILEGLRGNPTAVCFGLLYGDRADARESLAKVGQSGNSLKLLGVDGGVVGTIDRNWHDQAQDEAEVNELAVSCSELNERTKTSDGRCKFLLGDFRSLGDFLAMQLSNRGQEGSEEE